VMPWLNFSSRSLDDPMKRPGGGLRAVWPTRPAGPCGFAPPRNSSPWGRDLVLFGGRALFTVNLGRHASPGCCTGAQARSCGGSPTGSAPPGSASYRRGARGTNPWQHPVLWMCGHPAIRQQSFQGDGIARGDAPAHASGRRHGTRRTFYSTELTNNRHRRPMPRQRDLQTTVTRRRGRPTKGRRIAETKHGRASSSCPSSN
jgi:hypothetical protein